MLCCLGVLLSLPATTPDVSDVPGVPSALAGAKAGHVDRRAGNASAPVPHASYAFTPAEELQETDKLPVNVSLLTMLVLVIVSFGASVGWLLMTKARRLGAMCCSVVDDRRVWLATAPEGPSFLGVFRL